MEIGLEKWSFNYLLGLLDTLSPLKNSPNLESTIRWSSTRDLNVDEVNLAQNREDTLKRKSLDWGRSDILTKMSAPICSGPPIASPRPTLRSVPKRPPACRRHTGGYVEMNLSDNLAGYSSGYSSSNGSRSDEELDDFVVTPRFPEKNTRHIDTKPLKPKSPKVMVRRNSGYVDMKIQTSGKDSLPTLGSIQETPFSENRNKVRDLIRMYASPIAAAKSEVLPKSLPSSPNPATRLSPQTCSKDSCSSDITELHPRTKTAHIIARTHPYRCNSKDLILSSSKFLNHDDRKRSRSQNNLILI